MKVVIPASGFGTRIPEKSQFEPKLMVDLYSDNNYMAYYELCGAL